MTKHNLDYSPHSARYPSPPIASAIIAGGESTRMPGAEKCLLPLGEQCILQRIIDTLSPASSPVLLNANGDISRFEKFQLPLVQDLQGESIGPLGGIVACLMWLRRQRPDIEWLLVTASDTPFLPQNYVKRFQREIAQHCATVFFAEYRKRKHYLNSAWHVSGIEYLMKQKSLGRYSIKGLLSSIAAQNIDFSDSSQDPFFNINTPEDFENAKRRLQLL